MIPKKNTYSDQKTKFTQNRAKPKSSKIKLIFFRGVGPGPRADIKLLSKLLLRMEAFPPLVSHTAGGKTMLWQIRVEPTKDGYGLIIVERGHEGGKVTRDEKVIEEGKNLGKKNETTPLQQAILEARSAWNKKKSGGYEEAVAKGGAGAPSMAASAAPASVAASKKASKSLGVAAAVASLGLSPLPLRLLLLLLLPLPLSPRRLARPR